MRLKGHKKILSMVENIADLAHKKFRKLYREVNNGTRVKITKDKAWIKQHGTDQADLAKLNYFELPCDWQRERWFGAKVAFDALFEAVKNDRPLDGKFIESASEIIHQKWLEKNFDRAENEHKLSYAQLSEKMKEKDRIFARSAVEIYKKKKLPFTPIVP